MIPIIYKLRASIRFEARGDSFLVVSDAPLNVVQASERAVQILQLCNGARTLLQIADEAGINEDRVFGICDYFNRKSVLEIQAAKNDGYFPSISIIIPTRDRGKSVVECLESLYSQDYPADRVEMIVIDDGSRDDTRRLVSGFSCTLLTNPENRGQSYCRNLGAQRARHEILAFLDDDCVAGRTWLKDLAPYFQWAEAGAVGGHVDGYSNRSMLDRYEKEFSLLNLGRFMFRGVNDRFFVPTCNMLVRKTAFVETGGIRETLHVGEDVDFCWRLRDAGWQAIYVPTGTVMHKHRNTFWKWMRRRADYGASEAVLSTLHPHRPKVLQWHFPAAFAFLCACCAIAGFSFYPLIGTAASLIAETASKTFRLRRKHVQISLGKVCFSVFRTCMSFFYMMSFHLVRYYFVLFLVLGFEFHSLWALAFLFLMISGSVEYFAKHPRLSFPLFLFFHALDQISYQLGVLAGCLRARSFRSYLVRYMRRLDPESSSHHRPR